MTTLKVLPSEDRQFFRFLAEAAATNPFSDGYFGLQLKIADCGPGVPATELLGRVVARVGEKVRRLEGTESADVSLFGADDRELLRRAFLFDVYHRFLGSFERLMCDQVTAGERSIPVPFAAEALRLLEQRGFSEQESLRYFAIFYQVCRAFFFIDRALVGRSESMKRLRRHLWNNVFTDDIRVYERFLWNRMEDFSTMLLGDTGTGKGAAAAAIGQSGFIPFDEKRKAFVESFISGFTALNLSQFPESLIESELFGHRKGAFTGAVEAHDGVLSRCSSHGAIFLDEVGDVSVPVQIKLLHVLQERTFSPVGSHEKLRFHGRIIAATNKPLDFLRSGGQFRDDFFYRLCSDIITVPSLRQRISEDPAEVDDLVSLIVRRITGEVSPEIRRKVRCVLDATPGREYSWPGNVRELEQAVRRILVTGGYRGDLTVVQPDLCRTLQAGVAGGSLNAAELLSGYCTLLYERHGTYEEVSRRTNLDRRTVKAYISRRLS
jgi:DNA-binding NtrC family response regulator